MKVNIVRTYTKILRERIPLLVHGSSALGCNGSKEIVFFVIRLQLVALCLHN